MNKLKPEMQVSVLNALVEGSSIRSVERMTGAHRDTITRLLVRVGATCEAIMDEKMRNLSCKRLEVDELWCFVGKKQRHVSDTDDPSKVGAFWTFVALDSDTKLVPAYAVGKRDAPTAIEFMRDLASRLSNRVQLSSDALRAYVDAVEAGFGANVDYGQVVKAYEAEPIGPGRYSPPKVVSAEKLRIAGKPDMETLSTSYVERQNLTMRMAMRRFTRLTNAFSRRVENLRAAVALHFVWYNFVRPHRTLNATPAMAAGLANRPWALSEIVVMLDW